MSWSGQTQDKEGNRKEIVGFTFTLRKLFLVSFQVIADAAKDVISAGWIIAPFIHEKMSASSN